VRVSQCGISEFGIAPLPTLQLNSSTPMLYLKGCGSTR
jgi:hypothetical protein